MIDVAVSDEQKGGVLEWFFAGGTFKDPDEEYVRRATDSVAEIPRSGERWTSREAIREMQRGYGASPDVCLERIRGQGDLWVVEAVQSYARDGEHHICLVIEFDGAKIARETRYYAPISTPPERG